MKSTRPTVLVLALERLDRDIRIQKQIRTLQREFDVTLAAFSRAPGSGYDFVQLEQRKWSGCIFWVSAKIQATGYAPFSHLRMRLAFYISSIAKLDRQDLIVCNNVESLPIGLYLKRKWGCRLLADLHEYAAAGHRHAAKRDRAIRLCRDCFPHIDQALTVSHGLEKLYKDDFSLDCKVVPNVPYRHPGPHSPCCVDRPPFRMVCHGICAAGRGLLELLELAALLENSWSLTLMLVPPESNRGSTTYDLIVGRAAALKNVEIRPPVPADQVVSEISKYDAGVYLMPGDSLNKIHAMPNKFYDFIQAGLAVFVGPDLLEMAEFVSSNSCGLVCEAHSPTSMASLLASIDSERLLALKAGSRATAAQWCHEVHEDRLLDYALTLCRPESAAG